MKYGIVYYKDTDNIGDDIQNYAAMQFLPAVDYLIDRENLDSFKSQNGEKVAAIFNGWFMHKKYNWPPSNDIIPLCIAMHFSPNDYLDIQYRFLDGLGGEYLKQYEPIGSRDSSTLQVLEEKGIKTYLSGCLTLTLPKIERQEENYVCVVDIPDEAEQKVAVETERLGLELKKMTHWVDYKHENLTWDERMKKVEILLNVYRNAKCVITKRLHCALPCLAMGTPVLLLLDKEKDDAVRYTHFTNMLHVSSTRDFLDGNTEYSIGTPPLNSTIFEKERDKIIKTVKEFIDKVSSDNIEMYLKTDDAFSWFNRSLWQSSLLKRSAEYTTEKIDALLREREKIKIERDNTVIKMGEQYNRDIATLEMRIKELDSRIIQLDEIIVEKNQEITMINDSLFQLKTQNFRLRELGSLTYALLQALEEKSLIWNLFYSKNFNELSLKDKWEKILFILKNRKKKDKCRKLINIEDYNTEKKII